MSGTQRIEGNGALIEALDKGQLDLTLTIGFADRKDALLLGELPVLWIASRIYRVGILMYGKKPSWKMMWKWAFRNS